MEYKFEIGDLEGVIMEMKVISLVQWIKNLFKEIKTCLKR